MSFFSWRPGLRKAERATFEGGPTRENPPPPHKLGMEKGAPKRVITHCPGGAGGTLVISEQFGNLVKVLKKGETTQREIFVFPKRSTPKADGGFYAGEFKGNSGPHDWNSVPGNGGFFFRRGNGWKLVLPQALENKQNQRAGGETPITGSWERFLPGGPTNAQLKRGGGNSNFRKKPPPGPFPRLKKNFPLRGRVRGNKQNKKKKNLGSPGFFTLMRGD